MVFKIRIWVNQKILFEYLFFYVLFIFFFYNTGKGWINFNSFDIQRGVDTWICVSSI